VVREERWGGPGPAGESGAAAAALEGATRCLVLSPDGETILVGDAAGNVYCLWYVEQG